MMLPFWYGVPVFLPAPVGLAYAFYNYKLGIPMDQQEYVGFKWFTSLWSNSAQLSEPSASCATPSP
jgi:ABC-type polysaccharide transport system permease subunit